MLNQAPLNFKGHLLILKTWPLGLTLQEICLNHFIFYVQIHGLPLDYMTLDNATKIGKVLGNLLKVEEDLQFGIACRKYIEIKVEMI